MKIRELKSVNADEFLSTEEAADELGIKPTAIRNYLHSGKLNTYKFKSLTLISVNEVQDWKKRQRKR